MKTNEGAVNIITHEKNATPHFKEHCTKIDISLVVIHFFFSETNVVSKYNPLFIDILDGLCHSLFTFLPFDFYLYSTDFEFYPVSLRLFIKTSKVLIRFNVLFTGFHPQNVVISCLIFHKKILPVNMELLLTAKTTPGLNTCTCGARAAQFSAC